MIVSFDAKLRAFKLASAAGMVIIFVAFCLEASDTIEPASGTIMAIFGVGLLYVAMMSAVIMLMRNQRR